MKNSGIWWAPIAALSVATSVAFGNPFSGPNPQGGSLTWSGFSNSSVAATISGNGGASYVNVAAGQFQGSFDPSIEADAAGAEADDFFRFFCVDINQYALGGPLPYTRTGVANATTAAQLTRLFDEFYPNAAMNVYYSGGPTNFGSFASANQSAAFQLAVWEIWYDGADMNLATGTFRASSSAAALAQTYLTAVGTGSTPAAGWTLYDFQSPDAQDYLSVTHTTTLQQAPEPGTLILFCIAVLTVWGTVLRRRQTA
jgi:hypothetical protein